MINVQTAFKSTFEAPNKFFTNPPTPEFSSCFCGAISWSIKFITGGLGLEFFSERKTTNIFFGNTIFSEFFWRKKNNYLSVSCGKRDNLTNSFADSENNIIRPSSVVLVARRESALKKQ